MEKQRSIPLSAIPFFMIHAACFLVFLPGIWGTTTTKTIILAIALFVIRKFGITGGYHRYFSHRSYKTSRFFQFVLAWLGGSAAQKGALWWAAHHRHHHKYSDQPEDIHSPARDGIWWSHVGWVLSPQYNVTQYDQIKDMAKFPELRWLNDYHLVPIFVMGGLCYLIDGWAGVVWGTFVSTVVLYHTTFAINSFCHILGRKRFPTTDDSKNSLILALVTLGEGWHNNHHRYQSSTRNGFYWWEIDPTYYGLKLLSWTGFIWGLKPVPKSIYEEAEQNAHRDTVARFSLSSVQHEINTLRRVVPTAAAIAIATVNTPEAAAQFKKADGPAIHKDVSGPVVGDQSPASVPPAGA